MTQLAMFVGRNLNVLKSAFPELRQSDRVRVKNFVDQFVLPAGLIALAIVAYKFWA